MSAVLRFSGFRLDLREEKLWRDTELVPLKPTTFAVLAFLARNPQRLVTKEELLHSVWAGVTISDDVVRWYIRELRVALGDDASSPTFIETAPRRGYRFLPEVISDEAIVLRRSTPKEPPIVVGVLHSVTGIMAATETPVVDATMLAIDELNERGGVLGRRVEARLADGGSNEQVFAAEAERLLGAGVCTLFGTWTSASRKAVVPIVEAADHLLFYPVQSEGLEQSAHVIYMGASPNQQALPAVRWAAGFLKRWRFFLLGWDSIYSHAINAIVRDEVEATGGSIAGEEYLSPSATDITRLVRKIVRSKADVIINSTVGDLNLLCVRALRAAGVSAAEIPTIHLSISEIELQRFAGNEIVGDYAAWNYFQSIDRPANHAFVERFKRKFGSQRVTADPMEAAYIGVQLWAQAVEAAGSDDVRAIRNALPGQMLDAPEGRVTIDANRYACKTTRVGRIAASGQFEVAWSSELPIKPEPYPPSRPIEAWHALLGEVFEKFGGRWTRA